MNDSDVEMAWTPRVSGVTSPELIEGWEYASGPEKRPVDVRKYKWNGVWVVEAVEPILVQPLQSRAFEFTVWSRLADGCSSEKFSAGRPVTGSLRFVVFEAVQELGVGLEVKPHGPSGKCETSEVEDNTTRRSDFTLEGPTDGEAMLIEFCRANPGVELLPPPGGTDGARRHDVWSMRRALAACTLPDNRSRSALAACTLPDNRWREALTRRGVVVHRMKSQSESPGQVV